MSDVRYKEQLDRAHVRGSTQIKQEILSNLSKIYYGKSPATVLVEDSEIPVLGTGGVYGWANRSLFDGPAIIVPRKGSLGNPQFVPIPFWPSDTTYAVVPNNNVDAKWLFYNLDAFDLTKLNEATGVPSINRDWLSRINFETPTLNYQRRIAQILSAIDEQIEQTKALISKYQQIKAGLMQVLFSRGVTQNGCMRPTREEAPQLYRETKLGWLPKEWEVKRLGEVLKDCGGYLQTGPFGSQLHAHDYRLEGVPVVMPQDINDGIISTDQIARIVARKAEELSRHIMCVGDIVIARRGELSRAAAITGDQEGWLCGTGCFLLRLRGNALNPKFVATVYQHDLIQRQIAGMAVGTTMPSLNNAVMERLFFPIIDIEEQLRITERIEDTDQFISENKKRMEKLRQEKTGLMHDLLTGQVRTEINNKEVGK